MCDSSVGRNMDNCIFMNDQLPWNENGIYQSKQEIFISAWLYFNSGIESEGKMKFKYSQILTDCGYVAPYAAMKNPEWGTAFQKIMACNPQVELPMTISGNSICKTHADIEYSKCRKIIENWNNHFTVITRGEYESILLASKEQKLKPHILLYIFLYVKSHYLWFVIDGKRYGGNHIVLDKIIQTVGLSVISYYKYRKALQEYGLLFVHYYGTKYATLYGTPNCAYVRLETGTPVWKMICAKLLAGDIQGSSNIERPHQTEEGDWQGGWQEYGEEQAKRNMQIKKAALQFTF